LLGSVSARVGCVLSFNLYFFQTLETAGEQVHDTIPGTCILYQTQRRMQKKLSMPNVQVKNKEPLIFCA
jgi:hypothetical protein